MWNTDPVIVVVTLGYLCLLLAAVAADFAIELRKERRANESLRTQHHETLRNERRLSQGRRNALNEAMVEIEALNAQLREAQRNDHRDTKGRYASLEDVCVPPGNYPANR